MSSAVAWLACAAAGAAGWPQLQHDPQHTGYTTERLDAPKGFQVGWRTDFLSFDPPEHVYRTVQVVSAEGKLFIPTQEGSLFALDPATGKAVWRFHCGEGVLHTAGYEDGRVFFATIAGSVHAVSAADGKPIWRWSNGRRTGFSSAVCLAEGKVFVTGRGGDVHAFSQADGKELWAFDVPAPVYQTAAYNDGHIYFAAENMHCYCLAAADGKQVWKSRKLGGMSFRDYCPLVHRKRVILESQPAFGEKWVDTFPLVGWPPKKKLDPWLAKHSAELRQGKLSPETLQEIIAAQDLRTALLEKAPEERLFTVLDEKTGEDAFILPFFRQTMNGAQPPPAVDRDGMLVAPLHFVTAGWGRIDLGRQRYVDLLVDANDQFGPSSPGRGNPDECMNLSVAGNWVFAIHWQEGNAQYTGAFNLDTRKWTHLPCAVRDWFTDFVGRGDGVAHNAQCGNNAASIANGNVYHQAFHVVHTWIPRK
jgi:hypothetical protein